MAIIHLGSRSDGSLYVLPDELFDKSTIPAFFNRLIQGSFVNCYHATKLTHFDGTAGAGSRFVVCWKL